MLAWAVLWALYLSIVNAGQTWYGFGWESLLLEAGFLAIFLGNAASPLPVLVLWLLRWLLLSVEFGAGPDQTAGRPLLAGLRLPALPPRNPADAGPAELVLPPPARSAAPGRSAGQPRRSAGHVAQLVAPLPLVAPLAVFAPQPVASVAAAVLITTQFWLVLSGNFAWRNSGKAAIIGACRRLNPLAAP